MGSMCVAGTAGEVRCFEASVGATDAVTIPGVRDVIQLAGIGEETCALERSGLVKCWNERERRHLGGKVERLRHRASTRRGAGGATRELK